MASPAASPFAFQPAPPAEVKALQRALRAAGAQDASRHAPVVDGILGTSTIQALNDWNRQVQGTNFPSLTREQVLVNIVGLTNAILRNNVALAAKHPRAPAALIGAKVHNADAKESPAHFENFRCQDGLCKPATEAAKLRVIALQKALNQMPRQVRSGYPTAGGMIPLTGSIGPLTAGAYQVVLQSIARRQNLALPADLRDRTSEWLSDQLDLAIMDVTRELAAVNSPTQTGVPVVPARVATPGTLAFTMNRSGSATGNREWKCLVMQLQLQLNRFGQRLKVDGTVGANTVASFNEVMGQKWTAQDLARNLFTAAGMTRARADAKGMPLPADEAHVLAAQKCAAETGSPVADARYFNVGPVAVPTPAPKPTATPTSEQPLPLVPSPPVQQLQKLLARFPAPVVASFPGGKVPSASGVLSENDIGAIRAVLRWDFARQGRAWTDDNARSITLTSVSGAIGPTVATVGSILEVATGIYAQPAGAPAGSAIVGQSKGGLLYQTTPRGVVGYGPNAQAFTMVVMALQQVLARLAGGSAIGGDELGAVRGRHAPAHRRRVVRRAPVDRFRAARAEQHHRRRRGQRMPRGYYYPPAPAAPMAPAGVPSMPSARGMALFPMSAGANAVQFSTRPFDLNLLAGIDDDYAPGPLILGAARSRGHTSKKRLVVPAGRVGTAGTVRQPMVLLRDPGPLPVTGIVDARTVDAFNRYVAPTMEPSGPFAGAQIASDIENAVQLARNALAQRTQPVEAPMPMQAPVRPMRQPVYAPVRPTYAPTPMAQPDEGDEIAPEPALPMIPPSVNLTIPVSALAPERPDKPFPIWETIAGVAGAAGAIAGAWAAVRHVRRSRARARAR